MLKEKGFTLIELLVVVLIIGILAAIALPQYQLAVLKARYSQLMVMTDAIRQAQDAYYLATGKYALKINDLDITVPADCRVNDSGGAVICPKFTCVVYDLWPYAETYGGAYCYIPRPEKPLYYWIWHMRDKPERLCLAGSNDETAKKVCISMGGRFRSESDNLIRYYI